MRRKHTYWRAECWGVDEEEARSEVWDALGEVCNMVSGNFKGKTGKAGEMSVISVPTVIRGQDYRVRPLINGSFVECLMQTADGTNPPAP